MFWFLLQCTCWSCQHSMRAPAWNYTKCRKENAWYCFVLCLICHKLNIAIRIISRLSVSLSRGFVPKRESNFFNFEVWLIGICKYKNLAQCTWRCLLLIISSSSLSDKSWINKRTRRVSANWNSDTMHTTDKQDVWPCGSLSPSVSLSEAFCVECSVSLFYNISVE